MPPTMMYNQIHNLSKMYSLPSLYVHWDTVLENVIRPESKIMNGKEIILTLCNKEVEHGEDDCVSAEHVVTTRVHSCQGHPKPAPDGHGSLQFGPHVAVHLQGVDKS